MGKEESGENTSKVAHDILRFAEIYLFWKTSVCIIRYHNPIPTQQISHLQFHILNQFANIDNVTRIVLYRHVLLDLSCHVPTQIHISQCLACSAET